MKSPIVALCRFSFLGQGDWRAWRGEPPDLADLAARLYDPARLEQRFWTLEHLLLPAMAAQTDPDYALILLTSTDMPQTWQDRLAALAARLPQARVVVSAERDLGAALAPHLAALRGQAPGLVQVRIDDDDALSADFVARLAEYARRMQGFGPFSYSRGRGLVLSAYPGQGVRGFGLTQAFHAMGTAVHLTDPRQTVFHFGHFALQSRFPSFLDSRGAGFLALKLAGHDSGSFDAAGKPPKGLAAMEPEAFAQALARDFPGIDGPGLMHWLAAQAG